jgi:heme exporter protein B
MIRGATVILRRDLLVERRRAEAVPAMTLLAMATLVLLHFGLDRDRLEGALAAGVLWTAVLVAAAVGVGRLYSAEANGGAEALRLTPIDLTALFIAKAAALLIFLAAVEAVAVPAFLVLFTPPLELGSGAALVLVLAAGNLGVAVIGALVSALAAASGDRQLLVPLMALPLMVPIMIAAASATAPLVSTAPSAVGGRWIAVLLIYAAVFALVAVAVFEELLEE